MSPKTQHDASSGFTKANQGSYNHLGRIPVTLYVANFSGCLLPEYYLLVMAISQDPVLLLRVKEEAEDVEC